MKLLPEKLFVNVHSEKTKPPSVPPGMGHRHKFCLPWQMYYHGFKMMEQLEKIGSSRSHVNQVGVEPLGHGAHKKQVRNTRAVIHDILPHVPSTFMSRNM